MRRTIRLLVVVAVLSMTFLSNPINSSASPGEVSALAQITKEIQIDKPRPAVSYLQAASPWNNGELRYEGKLNNWIVTVLVNEETGNVTSLHLKKPGADNLEEFLTVLVEKYGQAKYRESAPDAIKSRSYGWVTGEARNTSLWYQFNTVFFTDSYI